MDESNAPQRPVSVDRMLVSAASGAGAREREWGNLVQQMARGEQSALAQLYDQTSGVIYALALRILRSPEDAEEAVLDAYGRAWKQAVHFDAERGGVMTWLVMMARSISIDRLRSGATRKARTEPIEENRQETSTDPNPEWIAAFAEERSRIQGALAQLPPEQRQVIELAFFGGLTHSELAAHLEVPLGTVKTRVRLGLSRLRTLLEELN